MTDRQPARAILTCAPIAALLWLATIATAYAAYRWITS